MASNGENYNKVFNGRNSKACLYHNENMTRRRFENLINLFSGNTGFGQKAILLFIFFILFIYLSIFFFFFFFFVPEVFFRKY